VVLISIGSHHECESIFTIQRLRGTDSLQYLSSILASIGGNESIPTPTPTPSSAAPPQTNGLSTGVSTKDATVGQKRKAESDLNNEIAKTQRPNSIPTSTNAVTARPLAALPAGSTAYRGTARPEVAKPAPKPLSKLQSGSASMTPVIKTERKAVPAQSTPVAPTSLSAPPKKGSYQEILARAKAAQAIKPNAGTIKHKQTEKLSRKERLALQEASRVKSKNQSLPVRDKKPRDRIKAGERSRTGSSEPTARKSGEQAKEKRKPLDLGYKGTMRPASAEPQYKGTMNLAGGNHSRKPAAKDARRGGNAYGSRDQREPRYASYSEDELDEEDDYASDVSSDMEADVFDVDREEQQALRAAKAEDAKAAAEEAEHRRKKDERKKMLSKMAADKAKKKPVY
jgi:protein SPT2